ncbi:uracil permease [Tetragenococcus halophilus subsp. halophilus]|uniref:Uracil permease n=2 Tax=Tetragenococcus halophilus TaxID=51669 RepID=A0AAN1SGQ5_TETHN|nr:uracil permease [Tetragenococcus halophilus]AOF48812.1 uracil permease [Tetragenococcus halophilus]MCF1601153.1 uracil permease [Tetragenococcus halophilus]MCO7025595.1 uracil permease [Tetragenococcus halophilus]MCO8284898.1 uracil permease [Tetragenococcus halophilus]MCO8285702.1 uracil permease [Tetragenococcus halophilus]
MAEKNEFRNPDAILDIKDRPKFLPWIGLSLQHLFTMFGATVLVPILVGLDPSIALFSSGVGTLLYILITKGTVPAYLGSSFAFITAIQSLMGSSGYPAVAQGIIYSGIVYLIVAFIIAKAGSDWIDEVLPPIVVGPVIMVIGLGLAQNAAENAMFNEGNYDAKYFLVALVTLAITIFFNMFLKGFLSLIPILLGIIGGYLFALVVGIVDLEAVKAAPWFQVPDFQFMFVDYNFHFSLAALISMAPIAFVTMTEHMGHLMVLSKTTKRDFFKSPGLKKTLFADGLSTIIAGFIGGPPTTSYGENIGVLAITKVHSVFVLGGAALLAVLFSFVGKISSLIYSIPTPVIGGISFLLFGVIASSGLRILIDNQIDFDKKRNLMITAAVLVIGIGGAYLKIGSFELTSMALATVIGIILNLVLPVKARSEE